MNQELFNKSMNEWIRNLNKRVDELEIDNDQLDEVASNTDFNYELIMSLKEENEELHSELKHLRISFALMNDFIRSKIVKP